MRSIRFGLLVAAVCVAANGSKCLQTDLDKFVLKTSCHCATQLFQCLGAEINGGRLDRIQQCFTQNGCTEAEAVRGTALVADDCRAGRVLGADGELKRRAETATSAVETTSAKKKTSEISTQSTSQVKAASTTSSPASTAVTTTEADSTTSAADSTSSAPSSTTASTTPSTTATDQSQTTSSSTTSTTLICTVDNPVTSTFCSYTSAAGKLTKLGCAPTITSTPSCAPGVICQQDTHGDTICLKRDNSLTTSGVVVTIAFSTAIVTAALSIFLYQMSSRAASRRANSERAALLGVASGKGKMLEVPYGQKNANDVNIPLMSPNGTRHEAAYPYAQQLDYQPSPADGSAPRLHPGLGALGQNSNH